MGLTAPDIDMLLQLRGRTQRIATIGRLSLYLHRKQITWLQGIIPDSNALANYSWGDPADLLLQELTGALEVRSIDFSDYEGASIVHDMNLSLADKRPDLAEQFDLVIDGGTLEHVFNFPVAVANMMFLVRKGGYVMSSNPANNLCGHGFYQFSPELMHRIYSVQNGFRVSKILLTQARLMSIEMDPRPKSFEVIDPALLGRRILLRNRLPVMITTLAEKLSDQPVSGIKVQQSDYVRTWSGEKVAQAGRAKALLRKVFGWLPMPMQFRIHEILGRHTLQNRKAMKRWKGTIL